MKKLIVAGSSGFIRIEVCTYFTQQVWQIHEVGRNLRTMFFEPQGDTRWNQQRLQQDIGHLYTMKLVSVIEKQYYV